MGEAPQQILLRDLDRANGNVEKLLKENEQVRRERDEWKAKCEDRTLAALELYDAAGDKDWTYTEWLQFAKDNPWLESDVEDE